MQQITSSMAVKGQAVHSGRMKIIIYCLFGIMFFFAISSTMIGILIPEMTTSYNLNNTQIGIIGSVQNVGGIAAMIFGGVLSDRFPKLKLIVVFFTIYTAVLFGIGAAPAYVMLLVFFFALGVANSYLNLLISAFVSEAYGDKRTAYLNMIHAFFSLGSLAGPIYASIVQRSGQPWNRSFVNLGVLCTAVTLAFVIIAIPVKDDKKKSGNGNLLGGVKRLLADRTILILALLCAAYMGHQSAIGLWITTYIQDGLGLDRSVSSMALILFWGGIVAGRFMQPAVDRKIEYSKWLCTTCFLCGVSPGKRSLPDCRSLYRRSTDWSCIPVHYWHGVREVSSSFRYGDFHSQSDQLFDRHGFIGIYRGPGGCRRISGGDDGDSGAAGYLYGDTDCVQEDAGSG